MPWSEHLLDKYFHLWNWEYLSRNESLPWSINLLNKYRDKWDWDYLCSNTGVPWSNELVELFVENINWQHLSSNEKFPWSEEFVEKYYDKLDWKNITYNHYFCWNEKYINYIFTLFPINGFCIAHNEGVHWNIEILRKYHNRLDYHDLVVNDSVYNNVIAPLINDDIVEQVLFS